MSKPRENTSEQLADDVNWVRRQCAGQQDCEHGRWLTTGGALRDEHMLYAGRQQLGPEEPALDLWTCRHCLSTLAVEVGSWASPA